MLPQSPKETGIQVMKKRA